MSSVKQLLLQNQTQKTSKSNFKTSVFITEGRGLFIGKKSWLRGEINLKKFDILSPFPRPTGKEILRSIKKGEKETMIWSIRLLGLWFCRVVGWGYWFLRKLLWVCRMICSLDFTFDCRIKEKKTQSRILVLYASEDCCCIGMCLGRAIMKLELGWEYVCLGFGLMEICKKSQNFGLKIESRWGLE